ncbi:MAG: cold shock domain-containing protein [Bacteroidetes bacterium]|nr:cold shock domain-containing protein [Bacteroidota bacterium]MBU1115660.1 cold shock domain-containing protein [Bacteroidota bacterium]MBU1799027.1 cold shock domain-containing protein [Bacteroidota bacterium]
MNQNNETEVLDFCRIKKIFDKGFGFLTSLYHQENVFFHFSKIKDKEKRQSLFDLKRGVISVFFTSKISDGQRKVDKVWLNIAEVPENLLANFIERLILELNDGVTNPFEIIDALNQLNQIGKLTEQNLKEIISSKKIVKNPSILNKLLSTDNRMN